MIEDTYVIAESHPIDWNLPIFYCADLLWWAFCHILLTWLCSPRGSPQTRIQNELGLRRIRRLIQSQAIVGTEAEDNIVSRVYSCVVTVKTEKYLFGGVTVGWFHSQVESCNSFSNVHKRYKWIHSGWLIWKNQGIFFEHSPTWNVLYPLSLAATFFWLTMQRKRVQVNVTYGVSPAPKWLVHLFF